MKEKDMKSQVTMSHVKKGEDAEIKVSKHKVLLIIIAVLLFIALLPYLIPLSKASGNPPATPYADSQFTEIDSVLLHYRLQKPEGQQPLGRILLVHGLGGSTYSFNLTVPVLVDAGYEVLSVDLPGFGYSSRSTDFDHSQISRAALLWKLIDQIEEKDAAETAASDDAETTKQDSELAPRWFLGGHSMGGGTVTAMAYLNPARTQSVILFDGALLETNQGSSGILQLPPINRYVQVLLERFVLTEKNFAGILASAYGKTPGTDAVRAYAEPLQLPGTARSALGILRTSGNLPLEKLSEIDVPFYRIWGREDTWVPFTQTAELALYLPNFTFTSIEGAYHCPMETHSDEFNAILLTYLKSFG